jgi:hypothetical protein
MIAGENHLPFFGNPEVMVRSGLLEYFPHTPRLDSWEFLTTYSSAPSDFSHA